eukprot:CAMPEP_0184548996 /NCGR_PEP_ID=MMETSP0199_2-20130426/6544_1 /TAXON_ID=1112570 /ORGANISM="Thraustochytrium sp., Strain LLF1b" /LENGTH=715 /DNA_ID=CAMNT_0026943677 /DNA_START=312 /DNA_END=2459 /DNA_ORIENTATION=+
MAGGRDKKPKQLDLDDDGGDEDDQRGNGAFKINQGFAKKFEARKRHVELTKAKAMGMFDEDDSSEEEEEEDEDGKELTGKVDMDIMKTIAMIRKKDDRIYKEDFAPFKKSDDSDAEDGAESKGDKDDGDKRKPVYYKDLQRQKILAKMEGKGGYESDSSEADGPGKAGWYEKDQHKLKKAFKDAFKSAEADENDNDDDEEVLKKKEKSEEELAQEKSELERFMDNLEKKGVRKTKNEDVQLLQQMFQEKTDDKDEEFLRNFVLNEGWVDKDGVMGASGNADMDDDDENDNEDLEDDKDSVEAAEEFETKYNFRFEEPGGDEIATYPRVDENRIRRKDNARKRQRETKKERKRLEKVKAMEELNRLKELKRKELEARLDRTRELAGLDNDAKMAFDAMDLEADFDPEEWDKKMAATFNDDYYGQNDETFAKEYDETKALDGLDEDDEGEEEFVEVAEKPSKKESKDSAQETKDDEEEPAKPMTKSMKKRLRKKKFGILQVDEEGRELAKMKAIEDELYKLDYEDIIADGLKTRFRYRQVKPNSYGLTTEEILEADVKLLNQVVSIKAMLPYRDSEFVVDYRRRRRFRDALREQREKEAKANRKNKKDKKGKKKKDMAEAEAEAEAGTEDKQDGEFADAAQPETTNVSTENNEDGSGKRKRKRSKKKKSDKATESEETATQIDAGEEEAAQSEEDQANEAATSKRKRKRKRAKKSSD